MANANTPMGLVPVRMRNGQPYTGAVRHYYVPATNTTALYIGDPVINSGTSDANGVPGCTLATAGLSNRITGVIVGFKPTAPFQGKYLPASTAGYALVADDPDLLFEVQETGASPLTAASVGLNVNLASGAGNAATGQSGWQIDNTTAATTATLQMRIVQLLAEPNNAMGSYAKWLVANNLPTETGAAGSTGI